MNEKYTQISLTYSLGDESLVKAGVYKSAVIDTVNSCAKGKGQHGLNWSLKGPNHHKKGIEELFILEPMKVLSPAEYAQGTCSTTLGEAFITGLLERPQKPRRNASNDEMAIFTKWKSMNNLQKIAYGVDRYVSDIGGFDPVFEVN